jgi:hypothetical protein
MDMSSVLKQEDEFVTINDERHLLKVRVKHLAAEAKIIRQEENQHHGMSKWKMQNHRKTTLRDAARRVQFAYAIVRGKTRERTAGTYGTKVHSLKRFQDQEAVSKLVEKYGDPDCRYDVKAWFEA